MSQVRRRLHPPLAQQLFPDGEGLGIVRGDHPGVGLFQTSSVFAATFGSRLEATQ